MADFSERLRDLRISKDLSQQALADYLNVNKQTISGYERGIRRPAGENAIETYEKIADYFNVDVSYLMGLSDVSVKIGGPCQDRTTLPPESAYKYARLDDNGKAVVNNTIDTEYEKYVKWQADYARVLKFDKITNLEDARALLGNSAAFGGYVTDEQLIKMANVVLKDSKKKKK